MRVGFQSAYFGSTTGGGEKYLGLAAQAVHRARPDDLVEILSPVPVDRTRYERILNLDLEGITLRSHNRRVTPLHRLLNRLTSLRPLRDAVLERLADRATEGLDVHLAMAYAIPVRTRAPRAGILCQFPYPIRDAHFHDRFQLVVCQSEYVREWVRRRWDRDAVVVNPPIDIPPVEPDWGRKERVILSVGRFIRTGHSKRQDVLVRAFRALCDAGLEGWHLHLAGSVHTAGDHAGYHEEVAAMAAGYPITLHPDASYGEVQSLYQRARIYWHAAGLGVDAESEPEKLEHFGMTTVEAMAAGCVPVVIALGGQLEIVTDREDGLLWRTPQDLERETRRLAADPVLLERLGRAARETSRRFSRERFEVGIMRALGPLFDRN